MIERGTNRLGYMTVGLLLGLGFLRVSEATADSPPVAVQPARAQRTHLRQRVTHTLTNIGFELTPGGSRLVLRIASKEGTSIGTPSLTQQGLTFEVALTGVGAKHRGDLLPLETRYFATPLKRAQLFRTRTGLVLRGELDNGTATLQSTSAAGILTITIDLIGTAITPSLPAPTQRSSAATPPAQEEMEAERPPALGDPTAE